MKKFSVAIIGLGSIGQGYDYSLDNSEYILSLASGFNGHDGFKLVAGVDTDLDQRQKFEKKFHLPSYKDLPSLFSEHSPDVFALSIPTDFHLHIFEEIIHCQPAAIFCEKPIASEISDAKKMVSIANKCKFPLLVNYSRRFQPGILSLKNKIKNNEVGTIFKGVVWYTKGFLNNASHFLDLLCFLFGDVTEIDILKKGRKWEGHDPEPDVRISFGSLSIYFLSGRNECFTINSMELVGTSGLIQYKNGDSKIDIFTTHVHPVYSEYTVLDPVSQVIPVEIHRSQSYPVEALYSHLTADTPLYSDGQSATYTLSVIHQVLKHL